MVFMPPRHGKSTLASHYFPAWFLGKHPDRRVILASYEAGFAAGWGRRVRDAIRDAHELGVFPDIVLRDDSTAANRWEIANYGGGMITAGVGGAISGRGADLLIIDDPIKNAEEANSPTIREKIWEWYASTAYTRLEPGGAVLLIQTRWHIDDLAGRLLQQSAEEWEIICLPALAEEGDPLGRKPGEALWPQRFPKRVLEEKRRQIGEYYWAALYQQRPIPRGGGLFKTDWIEVVNAAPAEARRVRYWDRAASTGKGDYTVGVLMAERNGVFYIIDVRRGQYSPAEAERIIRLTAEIDGVEVPVRMEQEPGASGADMIMHYTRLLAGFDFRGERVSGDKVIRAEPFAAQVEAGNVKIVRGRWNSDFLNELEIFPHGEHDDQVDSASGAFRALTATAGYFDEPDTMPTVLELPW